MQVRILSGVLLSNKRKIMSRTYRSVPEYPGVRENRDEKPWYKPPKKFKKPRRQKERAKQKDTLRHVGVEIDPEEVVFPDPKKDDVWDWN